MALKFSTSVAKGLKLKVRELRGLIHTFVEVAREKKVEGGGLFAHPTILNRVNSMFVRGLNSILLAD